MTNQTCRTCGATKPLTEFHKHSVTRLGIRSECKPCRSNDSAKKHYMRGYNLKRNYGITLDEYESLLSLQRERCAICGTLNGNARNGQWNVDHDHKTGEVRGLLCTSCNLRLAVLDNPDWMRKANRYIEASSPNRDMGSNPQKS